MSYFTLPPNAPSFNTDITTALIARVHNNPYHPTAEAVQWPAGYDEFVRKTNEAMSSVAVADETGQTGDIFTSSLNAYYLQHIPQRGNTIQVSDGVLDDSLTNWQQGIIYFSTLPSASTFVLTYMAQPDRYYGEYLTQIADVLHNMEEFLGAGTIEGEGLRNAPLTFVSKSANLGARFPHGVDLSALDRDITIQGVTTRNIRLGSGLDIIELRGSRLVVRGAPAGNIDMFFGMDSGDTAIFAGGAAFTGDVTVYGDLTVTGTQYVVGGTTQVNTTVAQTKLIAEYAAILGITTSAMTYVGGGLDVTGEARFLGVGNKNAKFDRDIELTNGVLRGVTHEGKIDGMNPSTVELNRRFYRSDFRHDYLNQGYQAPKYATATGLSVNTGDLNILDDSSFQALAAADPDYFPEMFNDGDYVATIISHPNAAAENGKQIPVVSYDAAGNFTLARNLAALGPSVQWDLHHRNAEPDVVRAGAGLTVTINADAALAAVAGSAGHYKSRRSAATVLSLPDDATSYIFMKTTENSAEIEEDEPTFFYRTHNVASDEDVLLARAVTVSGSVTAAVNFRLNGRWDSEWVRLDIIADFTGSHLLGNRPRTLDANFVIEWADDTGGAGGPGVPNIGPPDDGTYSIYLSDLADETVVVNVPSAGYSTPLWVRVRTT